MGSNGDEQGQNEGVRPVSPTEWFDQFPPDSRMDGHEQWCARHWAPCPRMYRNGILASTMVMEQFISRVLIPADIKPNETDRARAKLQETGRLCCWLGDEEMYAIWVQCPPAVDRMPTATPEGEPDA